MLYQQEILEKHERNEQSYFNRGKISCWEIFIKVLPNYQSKDKVLKDAPGLP